MLSSGFVVHYIRDYSVSSIEKTKSILSEYLSSGILNPKVETGDSLDNFTENLPIGTVICIDITDTKTKTAYVCLPMLSTHISLPVKPGEIVWFYKNQTPTFDDTSKKAHPMLSIENYWLSRKVGSRVSEDLSFAFLSRDVSISNKLQTKDTNLKGLESKKTDIKKRNKKLKIEEDKKIKLPDYKIPETYTNKYPFLKDEEISNVYNNSKKSLDVYPTAVPRWNSKPFELTLQGSNNSLINLTKTFSNELSHESSGAIDLVAGRHMLEDYTDYEEEDFFSLNEKVVQNQSDVEKRKIDKLSINKSSAYLKIKNLTGDKEVLKNQKFYFGEDFKKESLNAEGENNFKNDASRIYITEFDNLDNNVYYNAMNILFHNQINISASETDLLYTEKKYFIDEKNVAGKNFPSTTIKKSTSSLPSVLIKSNDIRIIARKSKESKEKSLEEGSIRLIKESNSFYNSSCVMLEKDGKVFIDGSIIHLGSFQKEVERSKTNLESEEDIQKMSGNGYGLLIGYEPKLSEPLVLGNTLEAMLKEMINVNIKLIDEIKKLSDDLSKHTHLGIPITGISGPPQVPLPYTNFSGNEHKNIKKRYEDLQKGLKDMLSKFAKTT
jgi:hypothetical protein